MNITAEQVIKHSLLYSFVASQPFAVYADAYPALQNKLLIEENDKLKFGEHGEIVRFLQQKLTQLSYYHDPIDGEFDIVTEHALKTFQASMNIDVTGTANTNTIQAVIKSEKDHLLAKIETLTDEIYPGMHGKDVAIVQEALDYFGYYDGEIDGIYGRLTFQALEIAEDEHGIELTNDITRESLTELYENEDETLASEQNNNSENQENDTIDQEAQTVEATAVNDSGIVETARSLAGTPYLWGGDTPGGFDCSGFINYVYAENNVTVPRTVNDIWNFSHPVDSPSIGDLVFFETYQPGPSHIGIYLGDGKFIHAGSSRGVETSELSNPYWEGKYLGAKRVQ